MVHRSDSRLLANLISHEKDYSKHFHSLLESSNASLNSLTAYAAASPPPGSHIILAVASYLAVADDALRQYAASVEDWRAYLGELKTLEDDVSNIMRDREILVTRVLKASKFQTNRNSQLLVRTPSTTSHSDNISLQSDEIPVVSAQYAMSTQSFPTLSKANKKLQTAQSELQACESHLALKERELDSKRLAAVHGGLNMRCQTLVECGHRWAEIGKELDATGLFHSQGAPSPPRNVDTGYSSPVSISKKPLPILDAAEEDTSPPMSGTTSHHPPQNASPSKPLSQRPSSDLSSIGPSQSASQINLLVTPAAPLPSGHIYESAEIANSPVSTPPISPPLSSLVHSASVVSSIPEVDLHHVEDLEPVSAGPSSFVMHKHVLPRRITEEDLGFASGSLRGAPSTTDQSTPMPVIAKLPDPQPEEPADSSDEEVEQGQVQVVENPRFNTSGPFSSKAAPRAVPRAPAPPPDNSPSKSSTKSKNSNASGSRFLGSIRGLFSRPTKPSSPLSQRDDPFEDEDEPKRGRSVVIKQDKKGKSTAWETRTDKNLKILNAKHASDDERAPSSPSTSRFLFPRRGSKDERPRVVSDASVVAHPSRLVKKRVTTATRRDGIDPNVVKGRRRSRSLEGNLKLLENFPENVTSQTTIRQRSRDRAEAWVDGQQVNPVEDKGWGSDGEIGISVLKSSGSVRRKKNLNRKSLPVPATAVSGTITNTTQSSHPQGSTSLSRNSSILSTSSSPPALITPRRRVATLGSSHPALSSTSSSAVDLSTPSSIIVQPKPKQKERRASNSVPPAGQPGEGSQSLMSIVEGVAKANQESRKLANSLLHDQPPPSSAHQAASPSTSQTSPATHTSSNIARNGALSLKSGSGAFTIPKAPRSIFDSTPDETQFERSISLPPLPVENPPSVHSNQSISSAHSHLPGDRSSRPTKSPLRSALRNSSRSPSPMMLQSLALPEGLPASNEAGFSGVHNTGLPSASQRRSPLQQPQPEVVEDDSDAASISSYETGHEVFDDDESDHTKSPAGSSSAPRVIVAPIPVAIPNGTAVTSSGASDISTASVSTEVGRTATTPEASPPPVPDKTPQGHQRRKSVRVSLQPSFSTTPPAMDVDTAELWNVGREARTSAHGRTPTHIPDGVRDMWADSSDEDEEYTRARRLLTKASRTKSRQERTRS